MHSIDRRARTETKSRKQPAFPRDLWYIISLTENMVQAPVYMISFMDSIVQAPVYIISLMDSIVQALVYMISFKGNRVHGFKV